MIIRKPSILLAAYNSFNSVSTSPSKSTTSSLKRKREITRQCNFCRDQRKNYATIAEDGGGRHNNKEHGEFLWPKPGKGQSCPTPYQIFDMRTKDEYTKVRFYELVKLYHPDRKSRL